MPDLEQKLKDRTAVIGIVGLGYVGLPLAIAFSGAGLKVLGFDSRRITRSLVSENTVRLGNKHIWKEISQ